MNQELRSDTEILDLYLMGDFSSGERITTRLPTKLIEMISKVEEDKELKNRSATIRYILIWGLKALREQKHKRTGINDRNNFKTKN